MKENKIFELTEIKEIYSISEEFICDCIDSEWITPHNCQERRFDKEDIARILLIRDLKEIFAVNNESIPIILHLIDQINWLKSRLNHYMDSVDQE